MTILAYVAQSIVIAVLFYRRAWRTVPIIFWAEMLQLAMMISSPLLPSGSSVAYEFWHDSQKAYIAINLLLFASYALKDGPSVSIAMLSIMNAALGFLLYANLDADWQLYGGGPLYLEYFILGAFTDLYIAWAVYTQRVGKPHEEKECQPDQSSIPTPNR